MPEIFFFLIRLYYFNLLLSLLQYHFVTINFRYNLFSGNIDDNINNETLFVFILRFFLLYIKIYIHLMSTSTIRFQAYCSRVFHFPLGIVTVLITESTRHQL